MAEDSILHKNWSCLNEDHKHPDTVEIIFSTYYGEIASHEDMYILRRDQPALWDPFIMIPQKQKKIHGKKQANIGQSLILN